jgi:hypothetical protein
MHAWSLFGVGVTTFRSTQGKIRISIIPQLTQRNDAYSEATTMRLIHMFKTVSMVFYLQVANITKGDLETEAFRLNSFHLIYK